MLKDDMSDELQLFSDLAYLRRKVNEPTRDSSILDIVLMSDGLNSYMAKVESPVAGSDHNVIILSLLILYNRKYVPSGNVKYAKVNFDNASLLLSTINWSDLFGGLSDVDDFLASFTRILQSALFGSTSTRYISYKHNEALP